MNTLCIRLPEEIDNRLNHLASQTGRAKTYYVREALNQYLEDMEDTYIALYRLERPEKSIPLEEVIKEFEKNNVED